jgi:hypothetical protein
LGNGESDRNGHFRWTAIGTGEWEGSSDAMHVGGEENKRSARVQANLAGLLLPPASGTKDGIPADDRFLNAVLLAVLRNPIVHLLLYLRT